MADGQVSYTVKVGDRIIIDLGRRRGPATIVQWATNPEYPGQHYWTWYEVRYTTWFGERKKWIRGSEIDGFIDLRMMEPKA